MRNAIRSRTMSRRGAKLSAFRRCIGLALLTTLVVALYTCPLFAAPATRLVYSRGVGADDCADEAALRRAVAERLGYDPFFPWAKLTLVASVRRASNLYYAHIEFLDAQGLVRGTRDFSGSHDGCGEVISAMALGISIALDTMDPRPPEPEPIAPASPASASPASTAPVSTSPARKVAVSDMRGPSGSQSAPAPAPSRSRPMLPLRRPRAHVPRRPQSRQMLQPSTSPIFRVSPCERRAP